MANCIIEEQNLYDIANAIRNKNGESSLYKPSQMAGKINNIESADTINPNKPVVIFDFNGDVIHSYTAEEFLALTEYPVAPTHEDLIFNEYTYTLTNAKNYVTKFGELHIGALYNTVDDATFIKLNVDVLNNKPTLYISVGINGSATIDWGDNTTSTLTGNDQTNVSTVSHSYSTSGLKKIKISSSVQISIYGANQGTKLVWNNGDGKNYNAYSKRISSLYLGYAFLGSNGLKGCYNMSELVLSNKASISTSYTQIISGARSLKHINIPKEITTLPEQLFYQSGIEGVCLPDTLDTIKSGVFNTTSLKKIYVPSSVTDIGSNSYGLSNMSYLEKCIIDDTVLSIGSYLFSNDTSLKEVRIPKFTQYTNILTESMFASCPSLQNVNLEGYTTLNYRMFYNCTSLIKLVVPKEVTTIGIECFNSSGITILDFREALAVPTLQGSITGFNPELTIIVPDNLYSSWIAASNWSDLSSNIIRVSDL